MSFEHNPADDVQPTKEEWEAWEARNREQAFRDAILAVCREHGAELEVTDDGKSYGMHSPILLVTMASVYEGDRLVKDFVQFNW